MPELVKLTWTPNPASGLPRSARRGCDYEAYVPDLLAGRTFSLSGGTAADVADAERAVQRLNREARGLADSEAVARLLLRAEAVASSRIEGLEVGGRRLLKAQLAVGLGDDPADVTATEILNNIEAIRWAVEAATRAEAITVDHLLSIHARLLAGTRIEEHGGRLRAEQNWIGGSSYNPCSAAFVPPPSTRVLTLLDDLCAFCNDDALPAIAHAAIAHAQFETIHPFIDGNGRTGRALIHVILRRRGLAPVVVPPVSLMLATWSQDYINGLTGTRYRGEASSREAVEGLDAWIALFAAATTRAVADAERYEQRVAEVQATWREALGRPRADSATDRLLRALPGAPVITVQSAAALIDRSEQAINNAIPRLLEAGVLKQTTAGRRNRAFEAVDLIDAFTDLERQLPSPDGDTRRTPPGRRVPQRRA
ncbi:Fic family protein [Baekduia sp.]|uniref:Fic family protein n=1 Tax=Baekduia sp. TaxID=2600305 RepID=UPI002E00FF0A|nr:Fic family protein [Baekduia sp.]